MRRTVALVMILLASRSAWTEPPSPSPSLRFSTRVDIVRLTVTVTDKKGNPVSDLRQDEIEVREDGRPQKIHSLAHTTDRGMNSDLDLSVALLLDVSGSMADVSKLSREAALLFLDAVPRARQLQVVLFAKQIVGLRYNTETRDAVLRAIVDTPPQGGTPLFDAVEAAVTRLPQESGRRVVVILSDGEDCGSRLRLEGLLRFLRASDATVYAIDFSSLPSDIVAKSTHVLCPPTPPRALGDIASTTGGTAYRAGRSEDLPGILEKILAELRSQYVLGYVSDAPRQDGRYRKVEVRLKRRGLAVRHKAGYTAKGAVD